MNAHFKGQQQNEQKTEIDINRHKERKWNKLPRALAHKKDENNKK